MPFSPVQPPIVNRPKTPLVLWFQQVLRRQPMSRQLLGGQVTPAIPQVGWQVAQDVNKLQSLAKANTMAEQVGFVQTLAGIEMRQAHLRPEFPNAPRHPIGIILQFRGRPQGHYALGAGARKTLQIQFLPAGYRAQNLANELNVSRRQRPE